MKQPQQKSFSRREPRQPSVTTKLFLDFANSLTPDDKSKLRLFTSSGIYSEIVSALRTFNVVLVTAAEMGLEEFSFGTQKDRAERNGFRFVPREVNDLHSGGMKAWLAEIISMAELPSVSELGFQLRAARAEISSKPDLMIYGDVGPDITERLKAKGFLTVDIRQTRQVNIAGFEAAETARQNGLVTLTHSSLLVRDSRLDPDKRPGVVRFFDVHNSDSVGPANVTRPILRKAIKDFAGRMDGKTAGEQFGKIFSYMVNGVVELSVPPYTKNENGNYVPTRTRENYLDNASPS